MRMPGAKAGDGSGELSSREEIILAQVSKGLTNKEFARSLNLREKTVKHYMTNIMQKFGARNRLEAALVVQKRHRASAPFTPIAATASLASEHPAYPMKRTAPQRRATRAA